MPEQAPNPQPEFESVLAPRCQACGSFAILTWPSQDKVCSDCQTVWDGSHRGIATPPLAAPLPRLR
jgi:hypothetical protein